jgi:hypothetical protein
VPTTRRKLLLKLYGSTDFSHNTSPVTIYVLTSAFSLITSISSRRSNCMRFQCCAQGNWKLTAILVQIARRVKLNSVATTPAREVHGKGKQAFSTRQSWGKLSNLSCSTVLYTTRADPRLEDTEAADITSFNLRLFNTLTNCKCSSVL